MLRLGFDIRSFPLTLELVFVYTLQPFLVHKVLGVPPLCARIGVDCSVVWNPSRDDSSSIVVPAVGRVRSR